jgi:NADH dehydrogenase
MARHRVVIVGGGFGGLSAALAFRRAPVDVTLVDRCNFHLFQPLLYQVATGGLSPGDITSPLRAILKRRKHVRVLRGDVQDLDVERRRVLLDREELPYDTLVLACGVRHHYFGNDAWEAHAPGLKTIEDAIAIRAKILAAFERAEREPDERRRAALLTFVIVGAGPTGVELAGAIGELARHTLRHEFRSFDPAATRILLVEGVDRVLPLYPERLSRAATRSLARLGVEVATDTRVEEIRRGAVTLRTAGRTREVAAKTVLWAAGVGASPLTGLLSRRSAAELDRSGRVRVGPDCSVPRHPEIFVIGDAAYLVQDGNPLPGVAPVAVQQGRYVSRRIRDRLRGREAVPFRYRDRGSLAVIGRAAAVADIGGLRFSGYPAWLLWIFVHIMELVTFQNRVLVFVQLAFSYLTRNRGARLITGPAAPR